LEEAKLLDDLSFFLADGGAEEDDSSFLGEGKLQPELFERLDVLLFIVLELEVTSLVVLTAEEPGA
jgi:hypothetical protein